MMLGLAEQPFLKPLNLSLTIVASLQHPSHKPQILSRTLLAILTRNLRLSDHPRQQDHDLVL
jgi:hypothetical protein